MIRKVFLLHPLHYRWLMNVMLKCKSLNLQFEHWEYNQKTKISQAQSENQNFRFRP